MRSSAPVRMIRGRLWTQVWVAILGILLITAAVTGIGVRMMNPEWSSGRGQVPTNVVGAAQILGKQLQTRPGSLEDKITGLAAELELRLALFGPSGNLLATSDRSLPRPPATITEPSWVRSEGGPVAFVPLEGGQTLVGGPKWEDRYSLQTRLRKLGLLSSVLFLLLLLSWPLSRRITRRLERLEAGVASLGSGDLETRVCVEGHDEVAQLARAFNNTANRIQALVQGQRRMLASASHEMRSPLARLRVAIELLSDDDEALSTSRRTQLFDQAETDIKELDELIEDMLLVGRFAADPRPNKHFRFVQLLALAGEEAARFGVPAGGSSVTIRGDERALRRMTRNLLENAQRYAGGATDLWVGLHQGWVELRVSDRGPGVPSEEQELIFEPFHRASTHRESRDGGVGLGLALVREIATAHGGLVRIDDNPHGGSLFVVRFPAPDPI